MKRFAAWALYAALVFGVGCEPAAEKTPPALNVIMICIDVLRADHVGTYGYERSTTPALDALARSGIVFEQAISPAAWTKPGVASYFTGRLPRQHGVYLGSREVDGKLVADAIRDEETTIAELFRDNGYRTVAVVANPVVDPDFGYAQGFESFVDSEQSGKGIRDNFLSWLDDNVEDQPFFAYVHFNDTHLPYDPPEEYEHEFGEIDASVDFRGPDWKTLKYGVREGTISINEKDRAAMINLYDAELLYVDAQIAAIMTQLKKRRLDKNTLVVVLSDHGEEFLEHGGIDHGSSLYDELLRVPLIMRFPDGEFGEFRYTAPVSTLDVLPTLADWAGFEPPADLAGRSLKRYIENRDLDYDREVYSEGSHKAGYQQALRIGDWKLIVTVPNVSSGGTSPRQRFSVLQKGVRVKVDGVRTNDGAFLASEIDILEPESGGRERITGLVSKVNDDGSFEGVLDFRVKLSSGGRVEDHEGNDLDRSAVSPGDGVSIYGAPLSSRKFLAQKIVVRDPSRRKKEQLVGEVERPLRKDDDGEYVFYMTKRKVVVPRRTELTREGVATGPSGETEKTTNETDYWTAAIERGHSPVEELYRITDDPGEQRNLVEEEAAVLSRMRIAMEQYRSRMQATAAPSRPLDSEAVEQLRTLGYIE